MARIYATSHASPNDPAAIRRISMADLVDCLRRGFHDYWQRPSHYAIAGLLYAAVMIVLAVWLSGSNVLALLFPLLAGFALVGSLAAVFFYEISRRREEGLDTSWRHGVEVLRSPALPAIAGLGLYVLALFAAWLGSAQTIYEWIYGFEPPASLPGFLYEVLTTQRGWMLILIGNAVGLVFALLVLSTTVVAFPMVVDRRGGVYAAMSASLAAFAANPVPLLVWGVMVLALLALGMVPLFLGLIVVMPVLGHATWHLYRRLVAPPE